MTGADAGAVTGSRSSGGVDALLGSSAGSAGRVVWLAGRAADVRAEVDRIAAGPRWHVVSAGPPDAEHSAFAPLRGLLPAVVGAVRHHRDLLAECGAELREVMPSLAADLPPGPALADLMQMPLPLARMLPLESELVFRIVARIGWLLAESARRLESEGRPPLVVHFPQLDESDRPTQVAAYHLALRAAAGGPRLLIGHGGGPAGSGDGPTGADARRELCSAIRAATAGATLTVDGGHPAGGPTDGGPSASSRADAPAPVAEGAAGGGAGAADGGAGAHGVALRAAYQALRDKAPDALARWRDAVRLCGRWFTPEAALDLAAAAREHPAVPPVEVWQATGIAQATLARFPAAHDSFRAGLAAATDPVERARLAMFLGLVSAKRLKEPTRAERIVADGLAGLPDPPPPDRVAEVALERGWLLNLDALLAYQRGDHNGALRRTRTAFELMRPHRDEESVGLKTNLVVNTSIVAESQGDAARALSRWRLFLGISDRGNDMFTHFYRFREAGLLVKAGDPAALDGYDTVVRLATKLSHLPGLINAARAGVHLSWRTGDHRRALTFARHLPEACRRLGDAAGERQGWLLIAACASRLGEGSTMDDALANAGEQTAPADWAPWIPGPPPTTLRYPAQLFLPGRPS